jgi:hypothetical protein
MRQQKQCIRIAGSKTKLDNEFKEQQVKLLGSIFFRELFSNLEAVGGFQLPHFSRDRHFIF